VTIVSTLVQIAIVTALIYWVSKLFFPSPLSAVSGAAETMNELNAKADAMVAKWQRDYVGNVYEGDAGRGTTERFVVANVTLGKDGPVIGVAFNPQIVGGKPVYDKVYNYWMSGFAQFANWQQVELPKPPSPPA
jgi:hypothetical protein